MTLLCLFLLSGCFGADDGACPVNAFGTCSGKGDCVDGKCRCRVGYQGKDCADSTMSECPRQCSGHGQCDKSTCRCDDGYDGFACQSLTGCLGNKASCSGHGSCTGENTCVCATGWGGEACEARQGCPNECSGRGICGLVAANNTLRCSCDPPFVGPDCGRVPPSPCPYACSSHGVCIVNEERCKCRPGFEGPACDQVVNLCNQSCHHGQCTATSNQVPPFFPKSYIKTSLRAQPPRCECDPAYEGSSCADRAPGDLPCAKRAHCSGHGVCNHATGRCSCDVGFTGRTCDQLDPETTCPSGCSGNGMCVHGRSQAYCACKLGWRGEACDISMCIVGDNGRVCSGKGLCLAVTTGNRTLFACGCDEDATGDDCGEQQHDCPESCNNGGVCVDGVCACPSEYTGITCNVPANMTQQNVVCCPYNCSDNGACDMDACACNCDQNWGGPACNTFEAGDDTP